MRIRIDPNEVCSRFDVMCDRLGEGWYADGRAELDRAIDTVRRLARNGGVAGWVDACQIGEAAVVPSEFGLVEMVFPGVPPRIPGSMLTPANAEGSMMLHLEDAEVILKELRRRLENKPFRRFSTAEGMLLGRLLGIRQRPVSNAPAGFSGWQFADDDKDALRTLRRLVKKCDSYFNGRRDRVSEIPGRKRWTMEAEIISSCTPVYRRTDGSYTAGVSVGVDMADMAGTEGTAGTADDVSSGLSLARMLGEGIAVARDRPSISTIARGELGQGSPGQSDQPGTEGENASASYDPSESPASAESAAAASPASAASAESGAPTISVATTAANPFAEMASRIDGVNGVDDISIRVDTDGTVVANRGLVSDSAAGATRVTGQFDLASDLAGRQLGSQPFSIPSYSFGNSYVETRDLVRVTVKFQPKEKTPSSDADPADPKDDEKWLQGWSETAVFDRDLFMDVLNGAASTLVC